MSDNGHFDFKKHWLALTPDEREAFAQKPERRVTISRLT